MSKFMMFDFRCKACDLVYEDMVKPDVHSAPCPKCQQAGQRLVSTPTIDPRLGVDADGFGTMGDRWARIRKQRAKQEREHYRNHGADRTPGADTSG